MAEPAWSGEDHMNRKRQRIEKAKPCTSLDGMVAGDVVDSTFVAGQSVNRARGRGCPSVKSVVELWCGDTTGTERPFWEDDILPLNERSLQRAAKRASSVGSQGRNEMVKVVGDLTVGKVRAESSRAEIRAIERRKGSPSTSTSEPRGLAAEVRGDLAEVVWRRLRVPRRGNWGLQKRIEANKVAREEKVRLREIAVAKVRAEQDARIAVVMIEVGE